MLADGDLRALLEARHPDPFAVLGCHRVEAHFVVRALLPGAKSVGINDAQTGALLAKAGRVRGTELFEARLPPTDRRPDYRISVLWDNGDYAILADAYAFSLLIGDADLQALREGRHPQPYTVLGAHSMRLDGIEGLRFAVWAPNASRVSVVGDFNAWDGRRHPMRRRIEAGLWEIFIPQARIGDAYKYELLDAQGGLLPQKADPYAFAAEFRPQTASRIAALPDARPLPASRTAANRRDAAISIYEVHLGSWMRDADGAFLDWDALATKLPRYAAELGFTHLELLPISEHPFDGSWGYQTLGLYAPSARFGDVQGFQRFVDACHAAGLGLILDWVPAHFPTDAHGMARFDGSALYEYADPREGFHNDWNTLIYHYGRNEVQDFLVGNARYWVERFGVDGLRVDAVASMLYRDYSRKDGEWIPNVHGGRENLEAIAFLRRMNETLGAMPGAITIAEESTSFPGVSAPTSQGGLGFHYKWNMGWMNDTLRYMHEEPVHRRWHHDKMRFGLVYAFSENFILPISHDEVVYGKGSMLGKMPGDEWQRFANLRAYYGFMWGHPGKKLLFMGQEFAQPDEWNHDVSLPWHLLDTPQHAQVRDLIRDLNALYRQDSALHALDCEARGFEWLVHEDADHSVFAWLRRDDTGRRMLVICNFTPVPREGYRIGLPADIGALREVMNTDSRFYGGSDVGNGSGPLHSEANAHQGRPRSIALRLPPLATLFLRVES